MTSLTLGSLFDGSGGFPLGGLYAGIRPVWASEIAPFPIRVTTKRLPFVRHYGDVTAMDGAKVEPVDIITFGSPCQDMSVAGRRSGLDGSRSCLFYEAVRIIKEMRCATDGNYPRYAVWENVPGAFSSNSGEDFQAVLEALCSVVRRDVSVPRPERWPHAGEILGDGFSLAWRVLDAQYWGVPQRRKRIYLVADFAGGGAGKVLFESEGLSGYSAESFRAWQGSAGGAPTGAGTPGICLNDQGGQRMDVSNEVSSTLRAEAGGHLPCVLALEHHPTDSRIGIAEDGMAQTLTSRMGTGGNNVPLVMAEEPPTAYRLGLFYSQGMISDNPKAGIPQTDRSCTLNAQGGNPSCQQVGVAVVEPDVYAMTVGSFQDIRSGSSPMLKAREYNVRRLTPVECARLQGFPDWWCDDLGTERPTSEEVYFWYKVFETWRKTVNPGGMPKTEKQIRRWLADPYSDSEAYKMWGNGVALPCVFFVMAGIAYQTGIADHAKHKEAESE